MTVTIKHKFVSVNGEDPDASLVAENAWNDSHNVTVDPGLVGRSPEGGSGPVSTIAVGSGLVLAGGVLSAPGGGGGGGGGSGTSLQSTLTNASGAAVSPGAAVYINGASTFGAAIANAAGPAQAIGLTAATIANGASGMVTFDGLLTLTLAQWLAITSTSGLTPGASYFLDPLTPGHLTTVPTIYGGEYLVYIGMALSTTDLLVNIDLPIALSGLSRLPEVTSISPNNGIASGSVPVTIIGKYFLGATSVKFGGVDATSVVVVNSTTITCLTPAHAAGLVDVSVTTPTGTGIGTGLYTCNSLAPTVTGVSPNAGPTASGMAVTITGSDFVGATSVTFGGVTASFSVTDSTHISATVPAHASGVVNVVVTTPTGTGTGVGLYTYVDVPTVTSVSPNNGTAAGGTSVTITGTAFTGATSVTFGGTPPASFVVVNSTTITCTAPLHVAGLVNVVVTTIGGTGTGTNLYTYTVAVTVTGVTPNVGALAGGTAVTITGTGFTGATASSVTFGGTAVSSTGFTVVSSTSITCTTAAHAVGTVDIVVAATAGTGTGVGLFTYAGAQATAFLARTSGLDDLHKGAYAKLINGLVAAGLLSKFDGLWILATQNTATAILNLISTSGTLVPHGSPAFAADLGYTGVDGSTTVYLDTQINEFSFGGVFTVNSNHVSVWSNNNVASAHISIGSSANSRSNSLTEIFVNLGDGNWYAYITANAAVHVANATGLGHYVGNRSGASAIQQYKNGSLVNSDTFANDNAANANFVILANNDMIDGVARGSDAQIGAASLGSSLSGTDVTNYYNLLRAYMTAVGAP